MGKILLSICIPTYNRASFLSEAISSVLEQITDDIKDKVEICISDNASTDNTDNIVLSFQEKSNINIVFHKNSINQGADKNFLKVIDIANGKYCWYLGSDDKISNGGIIAILKEIENNHDLIIFNRREFTNNFSKLYHVSNWFKFTKDTTVNIKANNAVLYFESCKTLGSIFSYISSLVIKKEKWQKIDNKDRYDKSFYTHTYMIFRMMKEFDFSIRYLDTPHIDCRMNDDDEAFINVLGSYKRLRIDYNNILIAMDVFGLDSKEVSLVKSIVACERPIKNLLAIKSMSNEDEIQNLYRLLKNFGFLQEYLFLLIMPVNLIKFLRKLLFSTKKLLK